MSDETLAATRNAPAPTRAAANYLEADDGDTRRFWELDVRGPYLRTYWGNVGQKGKSRTRKFASSEEARAAGAKLLKQRLAKGYAVAAKPLCSSYGLIARCTTEASFLGSEVTKDTTDKLEDFVLSSARKRLRKACFEANHFVYEDIWDEYRDELRQEYDDDAGDVARLRIVPLDDEDYRHGFVALEPARLEEVFGFLVKTARDALEFSLERFGIEGEPEPEMQYELSEMLMDNLARDADGDPIVDENDRLVLENEDWDWAGADAFAFKLDDEATERLILEALIREEHDLQEGDRYEVFVGSNNLLYFALGKPTFYPMLVIERRDGSREAHCYQGTNEI